MFLKAFFCAPACFFLSLCSQLYFFIIFVLKHVYFYLFVLDHILFHLFVLEHVLNTLIHHLFLGLAASKAVDSDGEEDIEEDVVAEDEQDQEVQAHRQTETRGALG